MILAHVKLILAHVLAHVQAHVQQRAALQFQPTYKPTYKPTLNIKEGLKKAYKFSPLPPLQRRGHDTHTLTHPLSRDKTSAHTTVRKAVCASPDYQSVSAHPECATRHVPLIHQYAQQHSGRAARARHSTAPPEARRSSPRRPEGMRSSGGYVHQRSGAPHMGGMSRGPAPCAVRVPYFPALARVSTLPIGG